VAQRPPDKPDDEAATDAYAEAETPFASGPLSDGATASIDNTNQQNASAQAIQ
jgi:hypothetical protein